MNNTIQPVRFDQLLPFGLCGKIDFNTSVTSWLNPPHGPPIAAEEDCATKTPLQEALHTKTLKVYHESKSDSHNRLHHRRFLQGGC